MRLFQIVVKFVLTAIVFTSLLTGCVVVERPYRDHHGYSEPYHGYNERYYR